MTDQITQYIAYSKAYPHLFKKNKGINIILDEGVLYQYAVEHGEIVGIVFENNYVTIVSDLIRGSNGSYYTYVRFLNKRPYAGVVVIPFYKGKIVCLKQFRHSTRCYEIELPRGFSEDRLSMEENAQMEIKEELGVPAHNITYVGSILSDTGLIGGEVHVFTCDVDDIGEWTTDEGIQEVCILTMEEVDEWIRDNRIRDCFTISAIYKYKLIRGDDGSNVSRFTGYGEDQ